MGQYLKKAIYTGITLATGAAGYLVGKYRNSRRIFSTTALGLILIMCAPRGFDLAEKYLILNHDFKKRELFRETKKDSINAVLELNYPKDTLVGYLNKAVVKMSDANEDIQKKYTLLVDENELKYKKSLDSMINQNKKIITNIDIKLSEQNNALVNRLNDFQNNSKSNYNKTYDKDNIFQKNNVLSKPILNYYLVDVDKSDRLLTVYGVYDDNSRSSLNISSRASLSASGGPDNGKYFLRNKGSRDGELFPGFLSIDDPVGISGAGENNQYLSDIQHGALTNKTGIRIPNEVYNRIANYVDTKKTMIYIHD